ncbi:MAG: BspA family leucine-rich repeat surface protein [Flavobacteriales bacterium]|jgi:surface protein|nr:BspA family leucine-rich repeat surface protein [Flavobacteriales bacterium]
MKKLFVFLGLLLLASQTTRAQQPVSNVSDYFITKWVPTSQNQTINFPFYPETNKSIEIDWDNDGVFDQTVSTHSGVNHSFISMDTITVAVKGKIRYFGYLFSGNLVDRNELVEIAQWGNNKWKSFRFSFAKCHNLKITATDTPDFSELTSLESAFYEASGFNSPVNNWDVSKVERFDGCFYRTKFDQSLSNWNTASAKNMSLMFCNTPFNKPINHFKTSKVENMAFMFSDAKKFNQPINSWNVSEVTDFREMFRSASKFNQSLLGWNTQSATSMKRMFQGALDFNQPISHFDVKNVTSLEYMFSSAKKFNQDLNNWNVGNVTDMTGVFYQTDSFNQDISSWNLSKVENTQSMFGHAKRFNQPIGGWDVSRVKNMNGMFYNATVFNQPLNSWRVDSVTNMSTMFRDATSFNQPLDKWNVSKVENMWFMFLSANAFNQNIGTWRFDAINDSHDLEHFVTYTSISKDYYDKLLMGLFEQRASLPTGVKINVHGKYCYGAGEKDSLISQLNWNINDYGQECPDTTVYFVTTWDLSKSEMDNNDIKLPLIAHTDSSGYDIDWDGDGLFDEFGIKSPVTHTYPNTNGVYTIKVRGAFSLFDNDSLPWQDKEALVSVDQWGSNQWETMKSAFNGCSNLQVLATDAPDLSKVKDLSGMFESARKMNSDISSWDVSNVENMSKLFAYTEAYNQDLNSWDVSNVTNMEKMFEGAKKFNKPLNSWNTSKITSMTGIFRSASDFNQPLDSWDVSRVKNMDFLFQGATKFNQDIGNWKVDSVTSMYGTFGGATNFNKDLNNWNVSNVTKMSGIFRYATSFNQPLNDWDVSNVTDFYEAFAGANSFNKPLNNWDVSNANGLGFMFSGASSFNQPLDSWDVRNAQFFIYMFENCTDFNQSLNSWDLSNAKYMDGMFWGASSFNGNINDWDLAGVIAVANLLNNATSFNQSLENWNFNSSNQIINLDGFINNTAITGDNYDKLLKNLYSQRDSLPSAVPYNIQGTFCHASEERDSLIARGWQIADGGQKCLEMTLVDNNPTCFGASNGSIDTLNVSGQVGAVTLKYISGIDTLLSGENLKAGQYTVLASDEGSKTYRDTIILNQPAKENASFSYTNAEYCQGEEIGTPVVSGVAGGSFSSPTLSGINGTSGYLGNNQSPGTHKVYYTSGGSCPNTDSTVVTILPIKYDTETLNKVADDFLWNGTLFTESVTGFKDTLTSSNGCDSIVTLNLTLTPPFVCPENVSYCNGTSMSTYYEYLSEFKLGTMTNVTTQDMQGYHDYKEDEQKQIESTPGAVLNLSIDESGVFANNFLTAYQIYVDWNQDGTFGDSGELMFQAKNNTAVSGSFQIPTTTQPGCYAVRVIDSWANYVSPCSIFYFGEVEDYKLNVRSSNGVLPKMKPQEPLTIQYTNYDNEIVARGSTLLKVGESFEVFLRTMESGTTTFQITDALGRVYKTLDFAHEKGINEIEITTEGLPKGVFFIGNSLSVKALRFVVQ